MINDGDVVFSGVGSPATLCGTSLHLKNHCRFYTNGLIRGRELRCAPKCMGTIRRVEILEVLGDVATVMGSGVREFYPDSKKTKTF